MSDTTRDEAASTLRLGLWLFLLSDAMIFASLFATYVILRGNTAGGPSGADLFEPPYVLLQTIALLASSYAAALALLAAKYSKLRDMRRYLYAVGLLGGTFLLLELIEFATLISEGFTWQTSAFLSAFFTLVGVHGLHVLAGLLWLGTFLVYLRTRGMDHHMHRKLSQFVLYWHFVDLVWIWVFVVVYMFGVAL